MRIKKIFCMIMSLAIVFNTSGSPIASTRNNNVFLPILPVGCPIFGQGRLSFDNEVLGIFTNSGYYTLDENLNTTSHATASKDHDDLKYIGKDGSSSLVRLSGEYNNNYWLWQNDSGKKMIIGQDSLIDLSVCGAKGNKIAKFIKNNDKTTNLQLLDSNLNILQEYNLHVNELRYYMYGEIIVIILSGNENLLINTDNAKYFFNKRFYCWSRISIKERLLLFGGYLIDMNTMEPISEVDGHGNFCGDKVVFWNDITGLVSIVNTANGVDEGMTSIEVDSNKKIIIEAVSTNFVFYQIRNSKFLLKNIVSGEIIGSWDRITSINYEAGWVYNGKHLFFNDGSSISKVDMDTGKIVLNKKLSSVLDINVFEGKTYILESEVGNISILVWGGRRHMSKTRFIFKPFWFPTTSGILLVPTNRVDKNGLILLTDSAEKFPESAKGLKDEFMQAWCKDENGNLLTIWTNGDVYKTDKYGNFTKLWHFEQFISKNYMISYPKDIIISGSSHGCCVYDNTQCTFTDYKTDDLLTGKCFVWKNLILMEMKKSVYYKEIGKKENFAKLFDATLIGFDNSRVYLKKMYPIQMMCFDGKLIYDMPEIAYSKEDELTSWGDTCLSSTRCAYLTRNTNNFSQLFYNSFSWRFIDSCRILGKAGKSLMEWSSCPTFTIKRTGNLSFEIFANRLDGVCEPLNAKVAIFACKNSLSLPLLADLSKWKKLKDFNMHHRQIIEFDEDDFCRTIDGQSNNFALVIESNGLLDTANSELADFDKDNRPLFDGIPISYDQQKSVVVTEWGK